VEIGFKIDLEASSSIEICGHIWMDSPKQHVGRVGNGKVVDGKKCEGVWPVIKLIILCCFIALQSVRRS